MTNSIEETIGRFYECIKGDEHHRYKSWEHCYSYFQRNPNDYDVATLHLTMYLASWGMYRGSTFSLKKDYKFHMPITMELLKPEYSILNSPSLGQIHNNISTLFDLMKNIRDLYQMQGIPQEKVSDTLVTKILLGTLGCIPAYDRFFIAGMKYVEGVKHSSRLKDKHFESLVDWCNKEEKALLKAQNKIEKQSGISYPIMKIVDMYFWQIGYENRPKKKTTAKL